jgi:2-polyprenyl-6-methoxyphenol hydroxylase-like FAD-dependent oxidoreductase
MLMTGSPDVVIVGGGIAGASLAAVLTRNGVDVLVLEKQTEYRDRVRGESMLGWGVAETKRLGLFDVLMDAGGHITGKVVQYASWADAAASEANPVPIGALVEGVAGSLNIQHRVACEVLAQSAADAGAHVTRGVRSTTVVAGDPPEISYTTNGKEHTLRPRLVIGADGRSSGVRKQVGIELEKQAPPGFFAGLLIEAPGIPEDYDFLGVEPPFAMFGFVQGDGRARVYLSPPPEEVQRYAGPDGPKRFIDDMALSFFPFRDALLGARAAGPCATYPGDDTWTDRPFAEGVVLIGDAAGHNNPLIGQGLSLAMRDVRSISEILLAEKRWDPPVFEEHGQARNERMRRVRFAANYLALLVWDFSERGEQRRRAFGRIMREDISYVLPILVNYTGPDGASPDIYEPSVMDKLATLG